MSFKVLTYANRSPGEGNATYHRDHERDHFLTVRHYPEIGRYEVSLRSGPYHRAITHTDDSPHATVSQFTESGSGNDRVSPPSERLKSLIASHHTNAAWMPLLDALAEEYPDHFESAVAEHTRARSESETAHYARALEATLTDLRNDTPLRVTRFAADGTRTVAMERPSEIAAKAAR